VWLAALAVLTLRRRPASPRVGPVTIELGPAPEPPAVVNFLAHGFKTTPEAVPATLLDLAARGVVTLEHRGPDLFVCRLGAVPANLTPYEGRIVALLRSRLSGGVVPPQALTSGPASEAGRWRRAFDDEVAADAVRLGLARKLVPGKLAGRLFLASFGPGALWYLAVHRDSGLAGLAFVIGGAFVLAGALSLHAYRETPAGLEAASRWLGVREALHEDEVFSTLPPITVGLWRRHLAYGAALGVAPGAVRPIPMGAESDVRAWSAYGGRWRAVRVDYPTFFPLGWGLRPVAALARGVPIGAVSGFLLDIVSGSDPAVAAPLAFAPGVGALSSAFLIARGFGDLAAAPVTTEGEILRLRAIGDKGKRYYVAVDDGRSSRVRAFVVDRELYRQLEQGERVVATTTRHLRHVCRIELRR
jgi:hypothetical protein